jgi:hypothetical protein
MSDQYAWWEAALAGTPPPLVNGQVESGFYRLVKSDRSMHAIATWVDEKTQRKFVRFNRAQPSDITASEDNFFEEVFVKCSKLPIDADLYDDIIEGVRGWPELPDAIIGQFSNLPADRWQTLMQKAEAEHALWAGWLTEIGGTIETEEQAARCAVWHRRVAEERDSARAYVAELREPLEEALDRFRREHNPTLNALADLARAIKQAPLPYLERKKREQQELRAQALREGKKAGAKRGANVGLPGAKLALRDDKRAVVEDLDAVFNFFREHRDVVDLLTGLATQAIRSGATVPGVTVETTTTVA